MCEMGKVSTSGYTEMKFDKVCRVPSRCLTHSEEVLSKHLWYERIQSHGTCKPSSTLQRKAFSPCCETLIPSFLPTLAGVGSPLERFPFSQPNPIPHGGPAQGSAQHPQACHHMAS